MTIGGCYARGHVGHFTILIDFKVWVTKNKLFGGHDHIVIKLYNQFIEIYY